MTDRGGPDSRVTVRLPKHLADRLSRFVRETGRTNESAVVASALRVYFGDLPDDNQPPGIVLAELANHLASWARRCREIEEISDGFVREMVTTLAGDLGALSAAALLGAQSEDQGGAAHLARLNLDDWLEHTNEQTVLRDLCGLFDLWSRRLDHVGSRTQDRDLGILARRLSESLRRNSLLASKGDRIDELGMREEIRWTVPERFEQEV